MIRLSLLCLSITNIIINEKPCFVNVYYDIPEVYQGYGKVPSSFKAIGFSMACTNSLQPRQDSPSLGAGNFIVMMVYGLTISV